MAQKVLEVRKIKDYVMLLLFGKYYLEGFCEQPDKKEYYTISSVVPNKRVMNE